MPKMRRKADLPTKPCRQCGRPMAWRKAWARSWDEVQHCSDRCRAEAKRARQAGPGGDGPEGATRSIEPDASR